jgi:hypothetical protein
VTSTQQWDCASGYPTPNVGDGDAGDWNMATDSTNVYFAQSSQSELIKFNKSSQSFDAIPLPAASSADSVLSIGIMNNNLYFVIQDGWGSGSELGYVNIPSWNAGDPEGVIYTGLASGSTPLVAPNNAQLGPSAFDGLSFNSTTSTIALTDYFRKQILVLQPNPDTYVAAPANNATVSGTSVGLDAPASDSASSVTQVKFELSGGSLNDDVIATGSPSLVGYLAAWNSTTVPDGTYTLQSVASDAAGNVKTSNGVTMTVNN